MQKHFIKQLLFLFVLPNAGIVLSLLLFHYFFEAELPAYLFVSLVAIVFCGANLAALRYFDTSFRQVILSLSGLFPETPTEFAGTASSSSFQFITNTVLHISDRLTKKQDELDKEKMIRIRSVIDGQDIERQRLSRELHDSLGQSLVAVKLHLENAGNLGHSQMHAAIDMAKEMIDHSIDEVRRITNALLPAALNELGLVTVMRTRCEEMANSAGLELEFESSGSVERLGKKSKIYLYRIALEAITNVIKHAKATHLVIKIQRVGQEVILQVIDNGKGFIFEPSTYAHRNGIQNIRERVNLLNGSFDLTSRANTGTTLRVTIPYLTENGKNSNHSGG